jgi:HEAT repeat protein
VVDGAPAQLPPLPARERIAFLRLWVHLHASLRGSATAALNEVGYRVGCDTGARALLQNGNRAERLLAMLVLGYLRDRNGWAALLSQSAQTDSTVSLYAAAALVQIDPNAAAVRLMPSIIGRTDWPLSQVVTILQDARDGCAPLLVAALPALDTVHLPRVLRIVEGLRLNLPPALHAQLLRHSSTDVIVGALRIAADPTLLPAIRALAAHDDWRIRVQAGKTLGRIGERSDLDILKRLLADAQWWVRYRAAQALVDSPFFTPQERDALAGDASDRFAADMLRQVIAEGAAA